MAIRSYGEDEAIVGRDKPQRRQFHTAWQDNLEELRRAVGRLFILIDDIEGSPRNEISKDPQDTLVASWSLSEFLHLEGKPLLELAERVELAKSRLEELLF